MFYTHDISISVELSHSRQAYSGLEISVGKVTFVHEAQPFEDLSNNLLPLLLWQRRTKVLLQVTMWNVLHSDEDAGVIVVPTKGLDKTAFVLDKLALAMRCIW